MCWASSYLGRLKRNKLGISWIFNEAWTTEGLAMRDSERVFSKFLGEMTPEKAVKSRHILMAGFVVSLQLASTTCHTRDSLEGHFSNPKSSLCFLTRLFPLVLFQCCLWWLKWWPVRFWIASLQLDFKFLKIMNILEEVTDFRRVTLKDVFS